MRVWLATLCPVLGFVCLGAGCSSASIDPRAYAADLPAPATLDAAARTQANQVADAAFAAAQAGRFPSARENADAALALDPGLARAVAALGLASMHEAQADTPPDLVAWRRAEGQLRRAQALAPDDAEVALALARFYLADGHGRAALDVLVPLLVTQPQHQDALRLAGLVAYEAGEERRARGYLARLNGLAPNDAQTLYRLANCEATVAERAPDDTAKKTAWLHVVELFAHYRALAPDDSQGYLGQAQAQMRVWQLGGKSEDDAPLQAALALYRTAQDLDAVAPEACYGEGFVREEMGDIDGAEAAYRRALERQPTHVDSLLNLAALLATKGELEGARALWQTSLRAGLTPSERRKVQALLTADG